jgi:hypothetical protein
MVRSTPLAPRKPEGDADGCLSCSSLASRFADHTKQDGTAQYNTVQHSRTPHTPHVATNVKTFVQGKNGQHTYKQRTLVFASASFTHCSSWSCLAACSNRHQPAHIISGEPELDSIACWHALTCKVVVIEWFRQLQAFVSQLSTQEQSLQHLSYAASLLHDLEAAAAAACLLTGTTLIMK